MGFTIAYPIGKNLYVNVTNRCTNRCGFCIRNTKTGVGEGIDLWLEREPTVEEIKSALSAAKPNKYGEVVFCGYGEPLIRFYEVMEVCSWLKEKYSTIKIRINTNGHANEILKTDVTPLLKDRVDIISISLNAPDAKSYQQSCMSDYGEQGFYILLDFAKKAKEYVGRVILSVVDVMDKEEIEKCRKIAKDLGVEFRVRVYSE